MGRFTEEMVDDYAEKLWIGLTPEENQMVLKEFDTIDNDISLITKIEGIEKVEPMTHCLDDFVYELREDVEEETVPIDELLQNCDDYKDREVSVPRVVG